MTRSIDNLPHFSPESDQAPSGGVAKQSEPALSVLARSFPDPDTLSSDSTSSLREQLRLVNQRIDDYIATDTLVVEKCENQKRPLAEPSRSPPFGLPRRRMERGEQIIPRLPNVLLNSTQTKIFLHIREKGLLKTPNPLRSRAKDRDRKCYYRFHRDYGHDTEECYDLKDQIEDLIHRGHLDRYIMKPCEPSLHSKGPVERHIDVIVGGPTAGGVSSSTRKAYARAEVQKRPRPRSDPRFTFESESDYPDHKDALVVTARIANASVMRIMIDTGSSTDILYLDAFHKLRMTNWDLIAMTSTLIGVTGDAIIPVGIITLPVTFDDEPRTKTLMVYFMMVDLPSAYNVIIKQQPSTS
ncbi:hypothetical protein B296_00013484 [Ensete ventricosum]|uniref:Peptidase A2 domain-containing protein n=1 Tax=Ensete ventricosum TaxID=4639 RepID=A0A427AVT8_ENSVE|nr:hypothetical protein B296_00013484 [Ensete ventricosum]